jgi:hypothetical protein
MTAKHRKIRRAQALHPDLKIRLLSRKDYRALALKFGWRADLMDRAGRKPRRNETSDRV